MRPGVRLGVDVGTVRVGLSRCDPEGLIATPLETVHRKSRDAASQVLAAADEVGAIELVVGLPVALSGGQTASTRDARAFAEELAALERLPVRLVDERLSTVSAHSQLRAAGKRSRSFTPIVDQAAATIILQHALDVERQTGRAPGEVLATRMGPHP